MMVNKTEKTKKNTKTFKTSISTTNKCRRMTRMINIVVGSVDSVIIIESSYKHTERERECKKRKIITSIVGR